MEAYIRQKRASPGMVQASDLQIMRPASAMRNGSGKTRDRDRDRDTHAYDGPLQFMGSPHNPDQLMTYHSTKSLSHHASKDGKFLCLLEGKASITMFIIMLWLWSYVLWFMRIHLEMNGINSEQKGNEMENYTLGRKIWKWENIYFLVFWFIILIMRC